MIVELLVNLVCKGSDYPRGKQMKPILFLLYKARELLIKKRRGSHRVFAFKNNC